MRYWLATLAGLGLCLAAVVAVDWGLYHLIRTGTCASGGPYVVARPCPAETGGHIAALMGGIFGGLAGIGIYAARGTGGRRGLIGLGGVMWSLLFVTIAASAALAAFGPAATGEDGAEVAAIVLAAIFVPMGLAAPAVSWLGRGAMRAKAERDAAAAAAVPPAAAPAFRATRAGSDPLERLQKLAGLRAAGALTEAEFEEQKRKLLEKM
ncbi:MAG: SHOCT domain-containing protein [Thermoleophilaceae bacterium]